MPKALAKAMRAVFTEEQLATCSFKGGITTIGDPRVCLPEAEREAVIDVMSRKFEVDRSVIETKMRSALRRFTANAEQTYFAIRGGKAQQVDAESAVKAASVCGGKSHFAAMLCICPPRHIEASRDPRHDAESMRIFKSKSF
ncbi:hypothetical protein DPMN_014116 [Dreissena polymorpha]|uniref:Uncharacterized protein n=1 Tax=Dreissena polymorpha TaxID=45954 RepID=A0A9D4N8T2_DREPO|nr:hypothetical protein DPMN_014116 [Dreissena polymorpha]